MAKDDLVEKVKEAGFESLDTFISANIHYLPESKQRLFCRVAYFEKIYSQGK